MAQQIQFRRGTAAAWTAANPTPALGEPCYETDTGKLKVGNGTTSWSTLPYLVTGGGGGAGTVTSVALTVPTGLAITGSPITTSGTLAITLQSGYAIPTTAKQTEWDSAYTDRLKWDGGSTGLNASTARTSLGLASVAASGAYADLATKPTALGGTTGSYLVDTVFAITDAASVALNPANGGVQTWTLGASRTATDSFSSGQSMILIITAGANTLTFPTITWTKPLGGIGAPTLSTTGRTIVVLWKVGTTLYGSYLGDA